METKSLKTVFALGCATLLLSGCAHSPPTATPAQKEIAAFRRSHPDDAARYSLLREANVPTYLKIFRGESLNTQTIVKILQKKYVECPGLGEHLEFIRTNQVARLEQVRSDLDSMAAEATAAHPLLEFQYANGDQHEWGFLVLKNGEITFRSVWGF